MMKRTDKRYYKVGETVWVKAENSLGVIKELNIKPDQNVYEALVEITRKDGDTTTITTKSYKLWEIDKNKRELFKQKRKLNKVLTKKPTILFAKVRDTAIIPSKEDENAGYDIYADLEEGYMRFEPHETKLVPTGVASSVIDDWALIVKERGSTGSKGMAVRAGVVDSGYRGEIFVAITNENDKPLYIAKDNVVILAEGAIVYRTSKAIAQLLLVPVPKANVKEISYDNLKEIPSNRGEGKLGDSGK